MRTRHRGSGMAPSWYLRGDVGRVALGVAWGCCPHFCSARLGPWPGRSTSTAWCGSATRRYRARPTPIVPAAGRRGAGRLRHQQLRTAAVPTWPRSLTSHGIDPGDDVVTSAVVAAGLVAPVERALVCGGPGIVEELAARGVEVRRRQRRPRRPSARSTSWWSATTRTSTTTGWTRPRPRSAPAPVCSPPTTTPPTRWPRASSPAAGPSWRRSPPRPAWSRRWRASPTSRRSTWVRERLGPDGDHGRRPARHRRALRGGPRLPLRAGADRGDHRRRPARPTLRATWWPPTWPPWSPTSSVRDHPPPPRRRAGPPGPGPEPGAGPGRDRRRSGDGRRRPGRPSRPAWSAPARRWSCTGPPPRS